MILFLLKHWDYFGIMRFKNCYIIIIINIIIIIIIIIIIMFRFHSLKLEIFLFTEGRLRLITSGL